jgi:nucleoside-diphosphate-sugar epimerase
MTKVLVTGWDGYVGSHVVAALKTRPVEIHVMTRNEESARVARVQALVPHTIALEDSATLGRIVGQMSAVAHLAASDNPAFLPVNRQAIDAMISGLPAGASLVMQGGSMVFGDTGPSIVTGRPDMNPPPAMADRAALEQHILDSTSTGIRTHIVYGSFVFGGRGALIPNKLVAAAKAVGYSGFIGDGSAVWSAVHVEDWADLIVRVLLDGKTSGQPVFAAQQQVRMRDAAAMVGRAFTPARAERSVSMEVGLGLWNFFAPGFAISQNFDGQMAREAYGWNPEPRTLEAEFAALVHELDAQA